MRDLLRNLFGVSLPALLLCAGFLEVFFRTVIPASDPPANCFDEETGMYSFCPSQGEGRVTIGKAARVRTRWRINRHGWNSEIEYRSEKSRPRIAVIGDSYIEAFQVDVDASYPALLRRMLGDGFDVYSFGLSGNPLSQYLHISRYARRLFDPDVLIVNVVHNDFAESILEYNEGDYHLLSLSLGASGVTENAPRANRSLLQYDRKKQLLIESALFRYFWFNLKGLAAFRPAQPRLPGSFRKRKAEYNANIDVARVEARRDPIRRATSYIFGTLRAENPDTVILVVMDGPRQDIYAGREDGSNLRFLHEMVKDLCVENGLALLDLTEPMKADYRAHRTRFESIYDNHWDAYGHRFVAEQVHGKLVAMGLAKPSQPPAPAVGSAMPRRER